MSKTLVSSSYELDKLLREKFGERYCSNPIASLMGDVDATFDEEKVSITFKENEYLLISTTNNTKEVLGELFPLLSEVMGNEKPICSYDLQSEGMDEDSAMPTIEWDVKEPDARLKEIANGRAFSDKSKLHNIKLYNSKQITDYIETSKEKENRIKNARIYGIDPGSIKDTKIFDTMSEAQLYLTIDSLGGHIWYCRHNMAHGRIPEVDLTEEEYALEYLVYQTTRFGVELPSPQIDKHITATPSYFAWLNFYDNHFKNILTDEQWKAFQEAKLNNQDTSKYMPKGNWRDLLEKGKQKTIQQKR